ncbi:general transcription factor 3C polypeptide 1-like [Penaeus monodon]|uniref:general transcription factor 3C polypeptide 1-like n=1 Tax=Penaeus monodon TaxID=6687 RepID=UPI0018A75BE7|nr:general transcription factor 3C polypeptide 1-like [Penaeus monodon]
MELLWKEISLFELPKTKGIGIFNRYEHMDPELGIVLEPEEEPKDIYPFHPVEDESEGVRGSCKMFHERVNVSDSAALMTLAEVEELYGEKLVLVAADAAKNKAPASWHASTNQLAAMGRQPNSPMFLPPQASDEDHMITKQPHSQKGNKGQTYNGSSDASHDRACGVLLGMAPRVSADGGLSVGQSDYSEPEMWFYVERRSKFIMMIQRAVEILKLKPGYCAPYTAVKEEMGMPETSCRKLFKSTEFQRYIKNVTAPYRKVYPDASPSQWRCKGKDAEKFVRIMELMNPKIDPMEVCKAEEVAEEDEEDDSYPGILDQHRVRCWIKIYCVRIHTFLSIQLALGVTKGFKPKFNPYFSR